MKNHRATPPAKKEKRALTHPHPEARAPHYVRRPECAAGRCAYPQPCCAQSLQPPTH